MLESAVLISRWSCCLLLSFDRDHATVTQSAEWTAVDQAASYISESVLEPWKEQRVYLFFQSDFVTRNMEKLAKSVVIGCARTRLVSPLLSRNVSDWTCAMPLSRTVSPRVTISPCFGHLSLVSQVSPVRYISTSSVLCAGHSKWQNIRHTKMSKDAVKQKIANQMVSKTKVAVKAGGGTNPKLNSMLAKVLQEAKSKDVPLSTLDTVLKRLEKNKGDVGQTYYLDAKGIGNFMMVVEVMSDKISRPKQLVQAVLKKFGGSTSEAGASAHCFDFKGVALVPVEEDITEDKATELAIEAEAEEVDEVVDETGKKFLRFIGDPKDIHTVKKNLENLKMEVSDVQFQYLPLVFVTLNEEKLDVANRMLEKLEEVEDVVRIYTNIEMS